MTMKPSVDMPANTAKTIDRSSDVKMYPMVTGAAIEPIRAQLLAKPPPKALMRVG
jgi:hypothetical protein